MSKHTPGPWEITGHGSRPTPCTYVSLGPEDDGNSLNVVGADHEANARLIAEAPAMLAFIERALTASRTEGVLCRNFENTGAAILARIDGGAA